MNFNRLAMMTVLAGLVVPVGATASNYCIAVNGGFGSADVGTTFIAPGFAVPGEGKCAAWAGFTKAASTVVLTTSGTGCLSSDGTVLTVSLTSNGSFFGGAQPATDLIQLCLKGSSDCPVGSSSDVGYFGGPAAVQSCTSALLGLPSTHD